MDSNVDASYPESQSADVPENRANLKFGECF